MGICKRTMAEEGLRCKASGLLALALGVALALGFVLGAAPRVALASTDTYTSLIPTDDDDAATLDKKTIRIFGHTWYVIKDESTAADAGTLTLLSLDNVGYSSFHQSSNAYSRSVVRSKLDAMTERGGRFENMEFLIRPVTLTTKKFESGEVFETIENAKLFLLSTDEAQALPESVRVADGDGRMATSIAALKRLRSADSSSNTVVIATGYCFVDALTVGPWCWATKSPLLLLDEDGFLPAEAVQAIRADGGFTNLVMLGGAGVASDGVADQLDGALGCTRLGGDNRYETSRKIAEWAAANGLGYGNATVATGRDFPDALAGVALAGKNASVLVVADDPADTTVDLLKSHKSEIDEAYVLGGANAVSDAVLDAIG